MKKFIVFLFFFQLFLYQQILADTHTWDGGGADMNWATAANWVGDALPSAGDDLIFAGTTRCGTWDIPNFNDFPDNTAFNSITVAAGAGAFYISGNNSIQLSGGATAISNSSTAAGGVFFLVPITFITSAPTITCNAGSSLTTGNINYGTYILTITGGGAYPALAGTWVGTGGIVYSGTGWASLSMNGTFSGDFIHSGTGLLGFLSSVCLGNTRLIITGGGSITNPSNSAITISTNNAVVINSNFLFVCNNVWNNDLNFGTGTVTLGTDVTITSDGGARTLTFGGVVSGAHTLTLNAPNTTLYLTGDNTYNGATTVTAGTLKIGGTYATPSYAIASGAVLELAPTADKNYTATTFTGAGTLQKTGNFQVQWGTAVATFQFSSGALIDVQAGVFVGGSNANEVWTNNYSDLTVASGAQFWGAEANERVDALNGAGIIYSGSTGNGYANFTFGVDNGTGDFSGGIANCGTDLGNFVKIGSGTQTFSGNTTYTGPTTISAGTLKLVGTYATPSYAIASGAVLELAPTADKNYTATTFTGAGTLRKTGSNYIQWGGAVATFSFSTGALIDVQGGAFCGGSGANEVLARS
jgi:autotransporter-associated beta strand protein